MNQNFEDFECTNEHSIAQISDTLQMTQEQLLQLSQSNPMSIFVNLTQDFQKLLEKAKRTLRREKAKQRKQVKIEDGEIKETSKKIKRKKDDDEILKDDNKKTVQMIRNRISAQNSRDRKKAYLQHLEMNARTTMMTNDKLKEQLEQLRIQNEKLNNKSKKIQDSLNNIDSLKQSNSRIGKIGLALITLVSVFSLVGKKTEETTSLVKIENSPTPVMYSPPLEKSFTLVDTNTYFEDKMVMDLSMNQKILIEEEQDYEQMSIYHLNSPHPYMLDDYIQNS